MERTDEARLDQPTMYERVLDEVGRQIHAYVWRTNRDPTLILLGPSAYSAVAEDVLKYLPPDVREGAELVRLYNIPVRRMRPDEVIVINETDLEAL